MCKSKVVPLIANANLYFGINLNFNWLMRILPRHKLNTFNNFSTSLSTRQLSKLPVNQRKPEKKTMRSMKKTSFILRRPEGLSSKPVWVVVEEDYDYCNEIARSAYADMLHDHDRNEKYYCALEQVIGECKSRGEKAIVLDIGTGTGLLSMMAVRAGADEVYACESFEPMLNCAKKVTKRNNTSKINLIPKRSTDLKVGVDLPQRCNILVTEVFDTELIGEHAIQTYNHAIDELLTPDFVPIPFSSKVFIQLVNSPTMEKFNTLPETIRNYKLPPTQDCVGVNSVQDMQLSLLKEGQDFKSVFGPIEVFQFDFSKKLTYPRSAKILTSTSDTKDKDFNVAFLYWTLGMTNEPDPETISCEPQFITGNRYCWREHWIQASYYLPPDLRQNLTITHDEFSFNFGRDHCTCGMHTKLARTRMFEINTTDYDKYLQLESKAQNTNCIVISDNTVLPYLLKEKYQKVKLLCDENVFNFESDVFGDDEKENCVIFGDPYFSNSLSCLDNLRFFKEVSQFKSRNVTVSIQDVYPLQGEIYCVFVAFKDLWKVKGRVVSTCGFDLTDFDELIGSCITKCDDPIEPQPVWQYEYQLTSQPIRLFSINHKTQDVKHSESFKLEKKSNAIVFFVNYDFGNFSIRSFDPETNEFSKSRNQSVMFLLENEKEYRLECSFNFEKGFTAFAKSMS